MLKRNVKMQITSRDSITTGTGTVPAGTTSFQSGLGTFFLPAPDHAKRFY